MTKENCYICENELPSGQSFYEDHNVKVCLNCFRTARRCVRCRFPSNRLKSVPGYGDVCEFCEGDLTEDDGSACYVCGNPIFKGASHYEGHGKVVCQKCFAEAPERCFSCGFPHPEGSVVGFGPICRFCRQENISKTADLNSIIQSLIPFLKSHNHKIITPLDIHWMDWRVIMGMQMDELSSAQPKFFTDLTRQCYPVLYLKERIYAIPTMPRDYFMAYITSQLVAGDLCQTVNLSHLLGTGPFQQLARGWCHWMGYTVARVLKYKRVVKTLARFPENDLAGSFSKFHAMTEFRKNKEIVRFAHQNLKKYAKKYL